MGTNAQPNELRILAARDAKHRKGPQAVAPRQNPGSNYIRGTISRIWKFKQRRSGASLGWRLGVCLDKQGNNQNQRCNGKNVEGMLGKNDAGVS